jgi:hypothetical protein
MPKEAMPADPMTELSAGAVQTHELYRAYVDAGFTPAQAMQIVCAMIAASAQAASGGQQ